ncbi:hypothetical protein TetV_580 [Tetraselmis virus 1]|uniref:Uncharacterized protein n=1 Tax=Tetraselmis virus 1 TaxID=2060617 RepID=A0A2P0VP67_9VIRU|nr:hypothetical protein QJ968_gp474 [Tetraselmis virus 1]AUF82662.1 hypothetical protein TetV_580 [Tetraselmis virus 1]
MAPRGSGEYCQGRLTVVMVKSEMDPSYKPRYKKKPEGKPANRGYLSASERRRDKAAKKADR